MAKFCVICGRVDHITKIIIHRFPTDPKRKQSWIEYIKKYEVDPKSINTNTRLCMRHFNANNDYVSNIEYKHLKNNAVPSVNLTKVNEDILRMEKINLKMLSNNKPIECKENGAKKILGQEFIKKKNLEDDNQFMYSDSECNKRKPTSILEEDIIVIDCEAYD